jgi:hypothetical protein
MAQVLWLKHLFEYLAGCRDVPPSGLPVSPSSLMWGLWWGLLTVLIIIFCGQSSKFIYIDF